MRRGYRGAGTTSIFDTTLYVGLDATGVVAKSGFSIVNFDFFSTFGDPKFNQPKYGFFCEKNGPINPLTGGVTTFNAGGVPLLVVK